MSDLTVTRGERGVVRVFALDLPKEQVAAFTTETYHEEDDDRVDWPLRDALGIAHMDHDFVEVFPVSDLGEMDLGTYLVNGHGVSEDQVAAQSEALAGVTGHVVIVLSGALETHDGPITPSGPLRHVATFREAPPETPVTTLEAESARGEVTRDVNAIRRDATKRDRRQSGMVATVALLVLAAVVVAMVLIAG